MAQKRMLNKSISVSAQVNELSLKSQLIFTWLIPHLDDFGYFDNRPEVIKAMAFTINFKISIRDVNIFLKEAEKNDLIKLHFDCIKYIGFENHQTISPQKRAQTRYKVSNPQESPRIPKKTPNKLREEKLREVKLREENLREINKVKNKLLKNNII